MKSFKKNVQMKGSRLAVLIALTCFTFFTAALQAGARSYIKPKTVSALTSKSLTMTVGQEKELKVKTSPYNADDNYLQWKIVSGSQYVRFEDDDLHDDDIDVRALKAGTAKVRCYIKGNTSKKVTFTIKVKAAAKDTSTITRVGEASRTVYVGDDFELKVKKSAGLSDRYLQWTIKNDDIVRFEDFYEDTGDDVEFWAQKAGTTTITCTNTKTKKKVTFTIKVKKPTATITREGPGTRMVELGDDFDLEVQRKSYNVNVRKLKWTISNKKIATFENSYETYGDDVEFVALKTGTVTITCTNTATGDKVSFTVNVVPYYDDDYDDDDYDDD